MHTPEDIARACPEQRRRVRAEIQARREAILRERIRGFHTLNRDIPARRIASFCGVSTGGACPRAERRVEEVLGMASPPQSVVF